MNDDIGKLVLRLAVGGMILLHGISKLIGGVGGIVGMLEGHGLPGVLAYGAYLGEVLGPLLVIIGVYTRIGALLMTANMLAAFGLAHMAELFTMNDMGGWSLELQGMFLFGSVAVALLGAGKLSVGGVNGRYN